MKIGMTDVLIDTDTRLRCWVNEDHELVEASSPQYGDASITTISNEYQVGLVDPCGNRLTIQLGRWLDPVTLCYKLVLRWAIKEEYNADQLS